MPDQFLLRHAQEPQFPDRTVQILPSPAQFFSGDLPGGADETAFTGDALNEAFRFQFPVGPLDGVGIDGEGSGDLPH